MMRNLILALVLFHGACLFGQGIGGAGGIGGHGGVGGGAASAPVLPASLMDAYLPSSLSASPVSSWVDSATGARNLSSAGASAPVWTASQTPHGNPAVTFDGVDNFFGSSAFIPITTDGTIYMLVKLTSISAKQSLTSSDGGGTIVYAITSAGLQTAERQQTSAIGTDVTTLSTGTWYRLAFSWSGGANWKFYVNGVLTNSGTNATTISNGINRIGANFSSGSPVEFFNGKVGFIGFASGAYDSAVDTYMGSL